MAQSPYWIKLHLKTLDSWTMANLPDHLWRRAVELFLMAKENGNDGTLQPVAVLAWRLRIAEPRLSENLESLAEAGVVEKAPNGAWKVKNFEKYQMGSSESADRVKRYREKHKDGVTCNVTSNALEESRREEKRVDVTPPVSSAAESPALAGTPFSKTSAFVATLLGCNEGTPSPPKWFEAIKAMNAQNVTEDDIRQGYDEIRGKNYTIVGAQSLLNPAINAKMRRTAKKNGHGALKEEKVLSVKELVAWRESL